MVSRPDEKPGLIYKGGKRYIFTCMAQGTYILICRTTIYGRIYCPIAHAHQFHGYIDRFSCTELQNVNIGCFSRFKTLSFSDGILYHFDPKSRQNGRFDVFSGCSSSALLLSMSEIPRFRPFSFEFWPSFFPINRMESATISDINLLFPSLSS